MKFGLDEPETVLIGFGDAIVWLRRRALGVAGTDCWAAVAGKTTGDKVEVSPLVVATLSSFSSRLSLFNRSSTPRLVGIPRSAVAA